MSELSKPLPPGSSGWPLLGETIPFLRDIFGFIEPRIGQGVFRTHLLGQPTVIMAGPEACRLWVDDEVIERREAMPRPVRELFGGASLPLLDGEAHRRRRAVVMAAFTPDALASYLPALDAAVVEAVERWLLVPGEQRWLAGLKQLAFAGICRALFGLGPGEERDALQAGYEALLRGFTGLPVNLPGTDFAAALAARDRLLDRLEALARQRQASPGADGLSRLLAARDPDGQPLPLGDLRLELHHMVIAGLIIYAEFDATIEALSASPDVLERLTIEVDREAPSVGPLERKHLAAMPYLLQVVLETKRWCKNVPVSFGRARRDFELEGFRVPAGWLVFLAVGANNRWAAHFREPDRFDPDRFAPARAEHLAHPHAYVPQGPGTEAGHRCAGLDFSTLFMQVFTARLVQRATWTLPPPSERRPRADLVPPEPRDGLRATLARRPRA